MSPAIRQQQQQQQQQHEERGETTTEMVLVTPVLLLLIAFVIQFALWYHASHVVSAAAQEGVRAARAYGGTAQAGQERAERFLAETGPTIVVGPDVSATRNPKHARVEVHGHAPSVVPGLRLPVDAIAESPTERVTSAQPAATPSAPATTGGGP